MHILNISIILALANGLHQLLVKMLTPIMGKVVILARVSTDKQEYQRQVNEQTDYCRRIGWSVEAENKGYNGVENEEGYIVL